MTGLTFGEFLHVDLIVVRISIMLVVAGDIQYTRVNVEATSAGIMIGELNSPVSIFETRDYPICPSGIDAKPR